VFRARPLVALGFNERYPLTLSQELKRRAVDGRHVEEQIVSAVGPDKAESPIGLTLDGALAHGSTSFSLVSMKVTAANIATMVAVAASAAGVAATPNRAPR
jgi:hypothetical protein